MKIAIAADHAGYDLKNFLRDRLNRQGHPVVDYGTETADSTDYPDYAAVVARQVACAAAERGVLVCSTGAGMAIAANKIAGVRAAVATNEDAVRLTRSHNDANVLAIGARFTTPEEAVNLVGTFLQTEFDHGPRHARRLGKIAELERAGAEEQVFTK